jgi:hypothetical protein
MVFCVWLCFLSSGLDSLLAFMLVLVDGFVSGLAEAPIFFLSVQLNQLGCVNHND